MRSDSTFQTVQKTLVRTLSTPRLTLELYDGSAAHRASLIAIFNDPVVVERMGDFGVRNDDGLIKLLDRTVVRAAVTRDGEGAPRLAFGTPSFWLLRLREGHGDGARGELIGGISLKQTIRRTPPDLGWAMLSRFHGMGYTTEAAREVLRFLTDDLRIRDILVWPGVGNKQSQNVARKIGFVEGGMAKDTDGEQALIYILPSMRFDPNMMLSS